MQDKKYTAIISKLLKKKATKIKIPAYKLNVMMAHWSNGYN